MNASQSSYVEYGTGNMLNLDAGTIKRKIDSNEYDDEILQEAQPNGKRTCSVTPHANQFATFGKQTVGPQTPNGQEQAHSAWPSSQQSNPSPLLRTAVTTGAQNSMMPTLNGFAAMHHGYQTPESAPPSVTPSPLDSAFSASMDMDMESTSGPAMFQNTNHTTSQVTSAMATPGGLLPSALPGQAQQQQQQPQEKSPYVPVHGRSMEIPSYARVPLNEVRQYRDQRWSSCIYGADTRIGQGMMI
ncbi:hypothetical protein BGZ75_001231 [Mortierella antarctica]|nr:hypothetical protein BGZ75_001231 [Mortierella antarctica]